MWDSIGPWLASGGGAGIAGSLAYLVYRLHRDAVQAYREQAAAWERIANMHKLRADLREEQLFGTVLKRASETV